MGHNGGGGGSAILVPRNEIITCLTVHGQARNYAVDDGASPSSPQRASRCVKFCITSPDTVQVMRPFHLSLTARVTQPFWL